MTTTQTPDFAAEQETAVRRLEELREERRRATLDDPGRLDAIEKQIAEQETVIERSRLASEEHDRREAERAAAEAEKAREDAMRRARKLQAQREDAATAVDEAAAALHAAVQGWADIALAQIAELEAAGTRPELLRVARPRPVWVEGAVLHPIREAGAVNLAVFEDLTVDYRQRRPLADTDSRPIEPLRGK